MCACPPEVSSSKSHKQSCQDTNNVDRDNSAEQSKHCKATPFVKALTGKVVRVSGNAEVASQLCGAISALEWAADMLQSNI